MSASSIAERLEEMSKSDLVQRLANIKARAQNVAKNNKTAIKRFGLVAAQYSVSAVTGVVLGLVETKMHSIPGTKIRFDALGAFALSGLNAAGVSEELLPVFQSSADAMNGHAWGRMGEAFARRHGVTQSVAPFSF